MTRRASFVVASALTAAALAAGSAAADGGPAPFPQTGWDGIRATAGQVRYVALPGGGRTIVAAIRVRDGRVLRFGLLSGEYGIPTVAFDGATDGISRDGKTLVLAATSRQPVYGGRSRFAVLRLPSLKVRSTLVLNGLWSFDALSPDAGTMYAIQYLSEAPTVRYSVPAVDLSTGTPRPGAIVDRREPDEHMVGSPVTRAVSGDGGWALTLYAKPNGTAFVHALDTVRSRAVCVDLPWRGVGQAIWGARLVVSPDSRSLRVTQQGVGLLATVDLRSFELRALRRPVVLR